VEAREGEAKAVVDAHNVTRILTADSTCEPSTRPDPMWTPVRTGYSLTPIMELAVVEAFMGTTYRTGVTRNYSPPPGESACEDGAQRPTGLTPHTPDRDHRFPDLPFGEVVLDDADGGVPWERSVGSVDLAKSGRTSVLIVNTPDPSPHANS
jgi:hypothetical protein